MNSIIPPAFAFRFALSVPRQDSLPHKKGALLDLPATCRLPWPGAELTDRVLPVELRAVWNAGGIGFSIIVSGKKHPPVSRTERPDYTDGFQIWLHTRSTRTIHRGNRLTHHFCCLPNGTGADGLQPLVKQLPVARAGEDAPISQSERFSVHAEALTDGYRLEVWLPAESLNGFDPDESPQLGFYCLLKDSELGDVPLTIDSAFPLASDPSLWQLLQLEP